MIEPKNEVGDDVVDSARAAPVNLWLQSLFSQVDIFFQQHDHNQFRQL